MRYRTRIIRRMVSGGIPSVHDDLRDAEIIPEKAIVDVGIVEEHQPGQQDQLTKKPILPIPQK